MKILQKREEAYMPTNQPANFPTFYTIPETRYVRRLYRAANRPFYHHVSNATRITPEKARSPSFIALLKQRIGQYFRETWSRLKQLGRNIVRWLAWRVVLPLSVVCAIWIPYVNPAELPY